MAGQVLTTTININAKGNGFDSVGAAIARMGSMVNGLSTKLIEFGEQSVEVFRNYEKSMADAEVALSTTYGRSTRELSGVMGNLDTAATEWAASTIFTTQDVGNAISEAAHAGWDYQQIMSGIPAAMQLAQAGSLDLSEAVNYIVKSTTAAGVGFEDMSNWIDLWAYAANSSASNIGEFGDAMLRMGSTMRFVADPEELFTLIAVTANAGAVGSEAGTMIRNSVLRLVAPTDKAAEAMAALGATSEESAEALNDESLVAANERLSEFGFTAYDSEGQLKSVLDIYRELYLALGQMAGGFDDLEKNQDALQILGAIFPTRTITEALTLLRGAAEGYDGLYESMKGGAAQGYGEYAAATMMDTLDGKILTFESKLERLKQLTGAQLAPQVENVAGFLGQIVDSISDLDDTKFAALVTGLEGVALVGPTLLGVGAVAKVFGALVTPAGAAAAAVVGLAAAIGAVNAANEELYKQNFGTLELDDSKINAHLQQLRTEFDQANESVTAFNNALQETVDTYTADTSELKSTLIQSMLDGVEIKEGSPEYEQIMGLGQQIAQAVEDGVQLGYASTMTSLAQTFGGNELGEGIDNGMWSQIVSVMESGMQGELERARNVGQRLRDALTEAFKDGHLTDDEINGIQSIIDEGNEILAQQQARDRYVEQQAMLRKAQTLGLDTIRDSVDEITAQRDEVLEELHQQQDADYWTLTESYKSSIANGEATEADMIAAQAELKKAQAAKEQETIADYQNYAFDVYKQGIEGSKLADTWASMQQFAQDVMENGGIVSTAAQQRYLENYDAAKANDASAYLSDMIDALGGESGVSSLAEYFRTNGQADRAAEYDSLLAMWNTLGKGNLSLGTPQLGLSTAVEYTAPQASGDLYNDIAQLLDRTWGEGYMTPEDLAESANIQLEYGGEPNWYEILGSDNLYMQMEDLADSLGMSITDMISQATGSLELEPEVETDSIDQQVNEEEHTVSVQPQVGDVSVNGSNIPVALTPHINGENAVEGLQQQGVNVQVDGDTQALDATIHGYDGMNLMTYVDGDATNLEMSITTQDGRTLMENVTGNTSDLASAIQRFAGQTITVNVRGRQMFASGGRATEASTFGEAGPEWAIPEQHSQNTASLLDAARRASGFSWPELIARNGGLNAGGGSVAQTMVYSPTIYANNAADLDKTLAEDKKRFARWAREQKQREEMEVFT